MKSKLKMMLALISALLLGCIYGMFSQVNEGSSVDKIVAIVGKEIILKSDVDAYIATFSQQEPGLNTNDPELRKRIINQMINEKLVVTKAIEDSITVTDEEVNQRWEYHLGNLVRHYGSEKRVEDIYGSSIAKIKNEYYDDIQKQLLAEKLRSKEFGEVKATPKEVEEFYKLYKDSLPKVPAQIEIYHIVRNIAASTDKKQTVYELAVKVRDSLLAGGDFAKFAARYSDDKATGASGGELGWSEKGKLFQEFEQAAFSLKNDEISMPVETPFGYHIIQTLNKNKDSVFTRHILFKFGTSEEDMEKVKSFLLELKSKAAKGESFDSLARIYSDEQETQGFGGLLGKMPLNMIPENIKAPLEKLPDNGITDPLRYSSEPKLSFHIIWKRRSIPEHAANLEQDYKEIEQMANTYKQNKLYSDWVEELRKSIYWEIKE